MRFVSSLKDASSVWTPFRMVLHWRVRPAMATASRSSRSLAPFSFEVSVWK